MTNVIPAAGSPWSTERVDAVLSQFVAAGLIGRFEVQLASAALRAVPEASDDALLALGLVARATRLGHVCVELDQVRQQVLASQGDDGTVDDIDVPPAAQWAEHLQDSALVASPATARQAPLRPLVWDAGRLYLQRYWSFELAVADALVRRSEDAVDSANSAFGHADVDAALATVFPSDPAAKDDAPDLQREAARRALIHPVTVIAGGPGTGKTHTVAGILAAALQVAAGRGLVLRAALAAPTGKAAARMQEAVQERVTAMAASGRIDAAQSEAILGVQPTTIHRLLGSLGRSGFRHDRGNPLPHDLVIIDETSMVSLPMLARLLDALRPTARLVLVGDPFQLSSIEAGTVMADLVGPSVDVRADVSAVAGSQPLHDRVTELTRGHRFASGSSTAALALAIRNGDGDATIALLSSGDAEVHWVEPTERVGLSALHDQVTGAARDVVVAALAGDGIGALRAAGRIKVLAAVRRGPNGLFEWSDLISAAIEDAVPAGQRTGWPRVGTPVMVTGNDPVNRLANGDVGVVVEDDGRWVVIGGSEEPRRLAPARLGKWEEWWAMTIHKSQGSEFPHAVVALPTIDSPILTRELLYTAVTRGKPEVTIVGSEEMIRLAISRPVTRASGLRDRLWPGT